MHQEYKLAFDPKQWNNYRARGNGISEGSYAQLGWVKNTGLLAAIIAILEPTGKETILDAGAGSGAVYKMLAPLVARIFAFDISEEMIKLGKAEKPQNVVLETGDIYSIKMLNEAVDAAVARMVFHHLADVPSAARELARVVKREGKAVIIEYVATDPEVQKFERQVFDLKEAGRHLWTGAELHKLITDSVPNSTVEIKYTTMDQYSVKDWIGKSGLPIDKQELIFRLYAHLKVSDPDKISSRLNMTFELDSDGKVCDVLVDRVFAHVIIKKKRYDSPTG